MAAQDKHSPRLAVCSGYLLPFPTQRVICRKSPIFHTPRAFGDQLWSDPLGFQHENAGVRDAAVVMGWVKYHNPHPNP